MRRMIYADNAATTKLDIDAFEAMRPYLLEDYANASQPYFFSKKAKYALKDARKTIAECIGAKSEEIYFTSGGTESDNWAVKCFGCSGDVKRIVTSAIEHHAILHACKSAGAEVKILPVNSAGIVSNEDLVNSLEWGEHPVPSCLSTLVSIMLVNNEIGTIEPIKELVAIAHEHGAYFHTDAVQGIGHIPIDVRELGVDMLSASGHKFNGPKGIGFLYIREGTRIVPYADGGAQESRMRAGTENVASIVAMATALKKNCANMIENEKKLCNLEKRLIEQLEVSEISFIRNGYEKHVPGNLNLSFKNASGEMLLHRLDLMGICVSTGSACDSVNTQISHVINAIGVPKEYAEGTIRISLGRDNTVDDVNEIAHALIKILKNSSEI
jgi:cysteine desulfurase